MAKEWVDHSLDMAKKAKNKLEAAKRAYADADKKLNETFAQLTKVEKAHRNAKSAFKGYEKQAIEAQKKTKNKMALTVVELKQAKKQLEAKEVEKSQAEQGTYDVGMTKVAESLTT